MRQTNSQSVSLCWSTKSSGAAARVGDSTLMPYSPATEVTMSEDVWLTNVRCLRVRIILCDES